MPSPFVFACPACRTPLREKAAEALLCPVDGVVFPKEAGIWRFLLPGREAGYQQFIQEYETVRQAEGRGSADPLYYRALPFTDLSGHRTADWQIRLRSYRALGEHLLDPLAGDRGRPLRILDAGAGNGWLSYRLAQRGHQVAALDLLVNCFDGLGAHVHYDADFTPVQAEFDRLPFAAEQFDLVLFNASLHYATDYATTLGEAWRTICPGGRLVALDSPLYRNGESGRQMVREREADFERRYGFPSNSLPSLNYLTYRQLDVLANELGLSWQTITPRYGLRWSLRPWKARLLGRREPAQFKVIVMSRAGESTKRSPKSP
jgi:SAM-dependent methyltransferase